MLRSLSLGLAVVALNCAGDFRDPGPNPETGPGSDAVPSAGGANGSPGAGSTGGGAGTAGPSGSGGGNSEGAGGGTPAALVPPTCVATQAGSSAFRRLTHAEYDNTIRDVLGDTTSEASNFSRDALPTDSPFRTNVVEAASPQHIREYREAAEHIAQRVSTTRLNALAPCAAGTAQATCAANFVRDIGRKLFRRPLTAPERATFEALYAKARSPLLSYDHAGGIRVVLSGLLQSPNFLYHVVRGTPAGGAALLLTPHELAERLSYFLTGAPPDDLLAAAADTGAITQDATLEQHARRLLKVPGARTRVKAFVRQWFEIDGPPGRPGLEDISKDAVVFPAFTPALRAAMADETERFIEDVFFVGDGRLSTVLTSSESFVNSDTAALYGLVGTFSATARKTSLNASQRKGILSHGSFLAVHATQSSTSPVHRGKFVRERLLCGHLPAPPEGITPPVPDPTKTVRELFNAHASQPGCSGCHQLMDPIGLGMEGYDGIGRRRETEAGKPVNESGEVVFAGSASGPFVGLTALAERLGHSPEVKACAARQALVFALGRGEEAADACAASHLSYAFATDDSLPGLFISIARSHAFRHVVAPTLGSCP